MWWSWLQRPLQADLLGSSPNGYRQVPVHMVQSSPGEALTNPGFMLPRHNPPPRSHGPRDPSRLCEWSLKPFPPAQGDGRHLPPLHSELTHSSGFHQNPPHRNISFFSSSLRDEGFLESRNQFTRFPLRIAYISWNCLTTHFGIWSPFGLGTSAEAANLPSCSQPTEILLLQTVVNIQFQPWKQLVTLNGNTDDQVRSQCSQTDSHHGSWVSISDALLSEGLGSVTPSPPTHLSRFL